MTASLLAVCLASHWARAQDDDFAREGFYAGLGLTRSVNLIDDFLDDSSARVLDFDDSFGFNARGGDRVSPWLGVEVEYEWLDGLRAHVFSSPGGKLGIQAVTANARLIYPSWGRFQPYLTLGAGAIIETGLVEDTSFTGRLGVGMDVYITRNLLANLGAEALLKNATIPFTGEKGVNTINIQLGLGWRF